MKTIRLMMGILAAMLLAVPVCAHASNGEGYIILTIGASDDNEGLTYALDSDDPDSFGPSNTFTVEEGTSHTVYVKDAAGNITSQSYDPPAGTGGPASDGGADSQAVAVDSSAASGTYVPTGDTGDSPYPYSDDGIQGSVRVEDSEDGQTIDIDLELGRGDGGPYELKKDSPAEPGGGTLYSKSSLDGTDKSGQVFYSLTTAEGDVFYILVDQGQESDNVYLLNQVHNQDLAALAVDGTAPAQTEDGREDDSLLKALSDPVKDGSADEVRTAEEEKGKGAGTNTILVMIVLIAAVGGYLYYQRVYKSKKEREMDAMDAPDMDQFSAPDDGTDSLEFDYGDDDKEQYLNGLIREDEEAFAASARDEAARAGWDEDDGPDMDEDRPDDMPDDMSDGTDGIGPVDIFKEEDMDDGYDPDLDGEE